jgi:hypothetical protein
MLANSSTESFHEHYMDITHPFRPRPLGRCDQEVHKRTLVTPHKVGEKVSNKEIRNQFEPCNVQVSLPRRAAEQSKVRSSGNNVP